MQVSALRDHGDQNTIAEWSLRFGCTETSHGPNPDCIVHWRRRVIASFAAASHARLVW
jgi:hypothetical protein